MRSDWLVVVVEFIAGVADVGVVLSIKAGGLIAVFWGEVGFGERVVGGVEIRAKII